MAFTYISKAANGFDSDSVNLPINCTGANLLVVAVTDESGDFAITSITYDGVPMTLAVVEPGPRRVYLYYLINPSSGTNNVSVSFADDDDYGIMAVAYYGDTPFVLGAVDNGENNQTMFTTSTDDELVVFAATDNEDSAGGRSPSGPLIERHDIVAGSGAGDFGSWFGDAVIASPGTNSIGYTPEDESAFAAASFKTAAAGILSVKIGGSFGLKPINVKISGNFVEKTIERL